FSAPTPSSPSASPPPPCSAPSPRSLSSPRSPSYRNHRLRFSHSCPAPLNPSTGSPFYQENWRNLPHPVSVLSSAAGRSSPWDFPRQPGRWPSSRPSTHPAS
ncbi:PPR repeat, partial [Musa troglodytarum]